MMFSVVNNCPYCNSTHLIQRIHNDDIDCVECGRSFTKQQAEEMTGIIQLDRHAYDIAKRIWKQ